MGFLDRRMLGDEDLWERRRLPVRRFRLPEARRPLEPLAPSESTRRRRRKARLLRALVLLVPLTFVACTLVWNAYVGLLCATVPGLLIQIVMHDRRVAQRPPALPRDAVPPDRAPPRRPSLHASPRRRVGARFPWELAVIVFLLAGTLLLWDHQRRTPQGPEPPGRVFPAPEGGAIPRLATRPYAVVSRARIHVHGRVFTDDGHPLEGVEVVATTAERGFARALTSPEGEFEIEARTARVEEVHVGALLRFEDADVPHVARPRDDESVEIVVPLATTLFLRRSFPPDLRGGPEVEAASEDGTQRGRGGWDPTQAAGLILGARPGRTYDVFLRHRPTRRSALLEHVDPGVPVYASLLESARVAGRIVFPGGFVPRGSTAVLVLRGLRVPVQLLPDARFRADGLPAGSGWQLHLSVRGVREPWEHSWPVRAGSDPVRLSRER